MLNHTLVCGTLPADGEKVMADLDIASGKGFVLASTSTCAISDTEVYYTATLVKTEEKPAQGRGISMRSGPKDIAHVDPHATPKLGDTRKC